MLVNARRTVDGADRQRSGDLLIAFALSFSFSCFYIFLAWLVSGGENWWVFDFVNNANVFYGDDAYRFFLARSAFADISLYYYNFVLPGALIFDGFVILLSNHDLFTARAIKGVLGAIALGIVWLAGVGLGVRRGIMTLSVLMLGLLPRYFLTAISFYGEAWLGLFISIMMLAMVRRNLNIVALICGIIPLIRPEGYFLCFFVFLFFLIEKKWRCLLIASFPSFAYFAFVLWALPSIDIYGNWRIELRSLLQKIDILAHYRWGMFSAYSPFYFFVALFGFGCRAIRPLWPVAAGALLWLIALQAMAALNLASFEERYMHSITPVFTLLWAALVSSLVKTPIPFRRQKLIKCSLVLIFSFFIIIHHLLSLTQFKQKLEERGLSWVAERVLKNEWGDIFFYHDEGAMDDRLKFTSIVYGLIGQDIGIDKLVIFDPLMYYLIDPREIPRHVVVAYPATTYITFHILLGGQIFVQHHGGSMYSYIDFGKPDIRKRERRVLYFDMMPLKDYPYTWKSDNLGYELYLFSYVRSDNPNVDIERVPPVRLQDIRDLYMEWRNAK